MKRYVNNKDGTWSLLMDTKEFGRLELSSYMKRNFVFDYDVANLGDDFQDQVPAIELTIEGNPFTLTGYTRDKEVVKAVQEFLTAVDSGKAMEGDVD